MQSKLSDSQLLARLVAFDSTSANSNLPITDFICEYLQRPAIDVIRVAAEDGHKTNVVVRVGGETSRQSQSEDTVGHRPGLVLSGHLDVVPANEPEWRTDPFTLTETEDAYIGRGACDMKGFVALAINTACEAAGWNLRHPLVLILSYDEEIGSFGVARLAESWADRFPLPTSTIVGEPTSLRVVRMHKGHLEMRVTLTGQSAHSAYPHWGINAIEPAGRIIVALSELRRMLEAERSEMSRHFPDTPFVALNVARVAGGEAVNIIPDRCAVELGVRVLPGMDPQDMIERVRSAIDAVDDLGSYSIDLLANNPPMLLPEDAPIYRVLCDLVSQSEDRAAGFATDAGILQRMGMACAVCGPGNIDAAHKPNESIAKSEFVQAGKLLEQAVRRCCG